MYTCISNAPHAHVCFNDLFSATNRINPIFTNLLRVLQILINIIMCMTGTLQRWHNIFFSLLLVIDYNLSAIRAIIWINMPPSWIEQNLFHFLAFDESTLIIQTFKLLYSFYQLYEKLSFWLLMWCKRKKALTFFFQQRKIFFMLIIKSFFWKLLLTYSVVGSNF